VSYNSKNRVVLSYDKRTYMRCKLEKHLQYFQKNSVEQTLFQGLNGVIQ